MEPARPPTGEVLLLMRTTEALLLAAHDEEDVLATATDLLGEHFGYGMRYILLYDKAADELYMAHAAGTGSDRPEVKSYRGKLGQGLTGVAALTRQIVNVPDVMRDERYLPVVPECASEISVPLIVRDELLGVLVIESPHRDAFSPRDEELLLAVSRVIALALLHARALREAVLAREEARQLAITDPLTGIYNARYLGQRLAEEVRRAERYGNELALAIVDSDALKKVNDQLGHVAGNDLVVQLARTIRQQVRASDIVARFGGDEFVVIMPETGPAAARATAERIRSAAYDASDIAGIERSVSVGVASFPHDAADDDSLFKRADEALYEAKREGKNRVVVSGPRPS